VFESHFFLFSFLCYSKIYTALTSSYHDFFFKTTDFFDDLVIGFGGGDASEFSYLNFGKLCL
jgi:hypothetical protein